MQKPLILSIALCLGLTGCQVFQKSPTWDMVTKVRPGEAAKDPDPSNAYAAKLHHVLAENGVEHKVVTYQYRYLTHMREEAVGTRTAVVYRDATNSKYPWWLKDDHLSPPFWLPNGDLNKQISFYIRREAEVLEQKDFPGGASSKSVVAAAQPQRPLAAKHRTAVTKIAPAKKAPEPATKVAVVKAPVVKPIPTKEPVAKQPIAKAPISKVRPVREPVATGHFFDKEPDAGSGIANAPAVKPVPAHEPPTKATTPKTAPVAKESAPKKVIAKTPVIQPLEVKESAKKPASEPIAPEKLVTKIRPRANTPTSKATGAENKLPPPIASHSPTPWTAPTELTPGQRPKGITYVDEPLQRHFLEKTATKYNPASPMDRRKMEQLKRQAAERE